MRVPVYRARGTLAVSILLALVALLLGFGRGAPASGASVPSRTPPPGHKKSPTPTPTLTPTPTPTPTQTAAPEQSPTPGSTPSGTTKASNETDADVAGSVPTQTQTEKNGGPAIWWDIGPSFSGSYSSESLVRIEQYLAQQGASRKALRKVYAPFIITGPAQFSDTWGSVRHNEGNPLRPHLGQDVFCEAGAEVLAAEPGRVGFVTDRLGGTVVRLHRPSGGYWYYAHLGGYPDGLRSGDSVKTGDVIGYCGNSGNAAGGAPHVHFGSYPGPQNPMGALIGWLQQAESEGKSAFKRREAKSTGVGTVVFVYDKKLVAPCDADYVAEEDPLEMLLTASN